MLSSLSGVLFLGGQTPGYLKEEGQYLPRVQSEQLEVPGLTGCGDMGFVVSPLFWEGEPLMHSGHPPHLDSWHCPDLLFSLTCGHGA